MKELHLADLFCGAGGTSTGAIEAGRALGFSVRLTAVNHNETAIKTHSLNHPDARHLCTGIDAINPRDLFREGELDVLWASPECTHHSIARGGKPINDQSRATAWCVTRWAEALRPGIVLVENVPEFLGWGPIGVNGRPIKGRRGEVFRAWVATLEALGYRVGHRVLCAADYGDPTTRERLFVYAVRGKRKLIWPNPTHAPREEGDLFARRLPYVPAAAVIDWTLPGRSIFEKTLVVNTIRRVLTGFERYALEAFLAPPRGVGRRNGRSFVVEHRGTADRQLDTSAKPITEPLSAVATSGAHHSVCASFLVQTAHGNGREGLAGNRRRVRSVDEPLPTICGNRGDMAKVSAYVVPNFGERKGQTPRVHSVDEPLPAVTSHGAGAVVSALIGQQSGAVARSVAEPAPTVATGGAIGLASYIVEIDHQSSGGKGGVKPCTRPLTTATTKARHLLLRAFLVSYYGTGTATPTTEAMPTVTTLDRFALVRPTLDLVSDARGTYRRTSYEAWKRLIIAQAKKRKPLTRPFLEIEGEIYPLEITHRMLQPRELAGAQGFRPDYRFAGNKSEQVKQIGNAVPRRLARALVAAAVSQNPDVSWLE